MNRQRILGAIAFPSFVLGWTAAAMLLLLQLQPAAALEQWTPSWEAGVATARPAEPVELSAPPSLDDPAAMREALVEFARHSEVMNGSWQPRRKALRGGSDQPSSAVIEAVAAVPPVAPGAAGRSRASQTAPQSDRFEPGAITPVVAHAGMAENSHEYAAGVTAASAPPSESPAAAATSEPLRKVVSPSPRPRLLREKADARVALRAGRFAEAYARLRPSVADARGDSEFLGLLALAAMRTGNHGEALVVYQHLVALEPETARWRVGFALAQERLGLDASTVYRDALALSDSGSEVRALLRQKLAGAGATGFT